MNPSSAFPVSEGSGYERVMGRWSRRLAEPFLDFAGTADGEQVLDIGCGTGNLAQAIVTRSSPQAVNAIDYSAAYIAHAKRRHLDARIVLDTGNVCELAFEPDSFDRVLSLLVLHFVPKTELALAEMRRVAKPGAVVAAAVWDARGGFVANRMFFDTAAALDAAAHERRAINYTRPLTRPGELGTAWRKAGFTDVEETTLAIRMDFACFDDYWAPYQGREGPGADYVASLDAKQRERLENALRQAYLDGEPDGARSYAALAWAVKGICPD